MNNRIDEMRDYISANTGRSGKWSEGVREYAFELLDRMDEAISEGEFNVADIDNPAKLHTFLLNGAESWEQYSKGGCSLVFDEDIKNRLHGEATESTNYIVEQGRALHQAEQKIVAAVMATR